MTSSFRVEHDSMGEIKVPADALWGAQTQRAVENFPISGMPLPRAFIAALGLVKQAAARANRGLELLDDKVAQAIEAAAGEVAAGAHDAQFPLDVFQTGSGTSTNMNANEVIAALATRRLGAAVHPNDHVNMEQSSNDVIPTTIHVSAALAVREHAAAGARAPARRARDQGARRRRHRQDRPHASDGRDAGDAGQELSGWRTQIENGLRAARRRSSRACWRWHRAAPRSAPASTPRPALARASARSSAR